jgi:hypothetical protein
MNDLYEIMQKRAGIDTEVLAREAGCSLEIAEQEAGYPSLWRGLKALVNDPTATYEQFLEFSTKMFTRKYVVEIDRFKEGLDDLATMTRQVFTERYGELRPTEVAEMSKEHLRALQLLGILRPILWTFPAEVPQEHIKRLVEATMMKPWEDGAATELLWRIHNAHMELCGEDVWKLEEYYKKGPRNPLTHTSQNMILPCGMQNEITNRIKEVCLKQIELAQTPEEVRAVYVPSGWWMEEVRTNKYRDLIAERGARENRDAREHVQKLLKSRQ